MGFIRRVRSWELKLALLAGLMLVRAHAWAQPLLDPWTVLKAGGKRAITRRADFRDAKVALTVPGEPLVMGDLEIQVRLQADGRHYAVVLGQDGLLSLRKAAGGAVQTLMQTAGPASQAAGRKIAVEVRDADGGVSLEVRMDGVLVASALDTGVVGGPPIMGAGAVGFAARKESLDLSDVEVAGLSAAAGLKVPRAGAPREAVSDGVELTAEAPGAVSVQFQIDGAPVGEDGQAPFAIDWESRSVANGAHAMTVLARDAQGRTRLSPGVLLKVENDTAGPEAGDIQLSSMTATSAGPSWRTDEPALCRVQFGPDAAYGSEIPAGGAPALQHAALMTGLSPGREYHYRIRCLDALGNAAETPDQAFVTPAAAQDGAAPLQPSSESVFVSAAAATEGVPVKAPQRFLSPALADGINDEAVFGATAREVKVFDVRGREVWSRASAGQQLKWDCRRADGRLVESGVYIVKITAEDGKVHFQSVAVVK